MRDNKVIRRVLAYGLVVVAGLSHAAPASAEGNCPDGQYPIGGQGVQGCAPIPGSAADQLGAPRPSGRWKKTWGGVAVSTNGIAGLVRGGYSKRAAEQGAVRVCQREGGLNCYVLLTYKHQCVAGAKSGGALGDTYVTGSTVEIASERAVRRCVERGGSSCEAFITDCSDAVFIKY